MAGDRYAVDSGLLVVCSGKAVDHASAGRFSGDKRRRQQTHAQGKRDYSALERKNTRGARAASSVAVLIKANKAAGPRLDPARKAHPVIGLARPSALTYANIRRAGRTFLFRNHIENLKSQSPVIRYVSRAALAHTY
jgi:hypothetical protein